MNPKDIRADAIGELLLMSNTERKIWMKDAYASFWEWMGENAPLLCLFGNDVPIGRVLNSMCARWINDTQDGARYLEQYTASLAPMNA